VKLMLGGPIIGGATLSRFFALHVFVIPGMLIGFVGLHLLMVIKLGINEWPMPGRLVKKATYEHDYHELTQKDGAPFVPMRSGKIYFSPHLSSWPLRVRRVLRPVRTIGQPDPTIIQTAPRPDYFFLWLYAVLSFLPPSMETPALLIGPVIVLGALLLLPFLSGEGEKKLAPPSDCRSHDPACRRYARDLYSSRGVYPVEPGNERMSSDPIPARFLQHRTALERQGALVFQVKQCHNCHALEGMGGERGPALDSVAVQLTQDQLIRQVIQGGGTCLLTAKILLRPRRLLSWHSFKRCIRRDRRRRGTLPELWHLEEAGRILPQSVPQVGHDTRNSIRIRTVVRFRPVTIAVFLAASVYLRGWSRLRSTIPSVISPWQLAAFMNGMFAVWIALGSPLRSVSP